MKVTRKGYSVVVKREKGDSPPKDESHFWYQLRNALKAKGEDVIKKEMSKDGHLVSDHVFYVRSRKVNRPGAYGIYDNRYALRDAAKEYRDQGTITFPIVDLS